MKSLYAAFKAESMKLRRSRILLITIIFFMFIPMMMGLMVYVTLHPEIGAKLGMIGTKAGMLRMGNTNWASYSGLINQILASVGLIGFGFVTAWIFGSEYANRTIKDLLALPAPRSSIVISKFIIIFIWSTMLAVVLLITGLLIGLLIGLTGWSREIILRFILDYLAGTLLTFLLISPVAFFASYGRGYLLPIGFVILTLILANFTGLVGLGPYFPWAIPGLYIIHDSTAGMHPVAASYVILVITCLAGLAGTLLWWRYADHH